MTKILTEEKIRAYMKCSELYSFGGDVELPLKTMMFEYVYIKSILDNLKYRDEFDFNFSLNVNMLIGAKALGLQEIDPGFREEITRHTALYMHELYTILRPKIYMPSFGPFEYRVNISKSVVKLNAASLLATSDHHEGGRVYHAVTFSPYSSARDMTNDAVQRIKLLTLSMSNPFKTIKDKPRVKLHIFSSSGTKDLNYASLEYNPSTDNKLWASYVEQPIKLIESDYHYPLVPCIHKCPYKNICNLDPLRVRGKK
jgi:hypothetical protein